VLGGQLEAPTVGAAELVGLAAVAAAPDRPHGVDHVAGREIAAAGNDGRAGGAAVGIFLVGLGHDRRTATAVDGPVDAAPAGQAAVGRVDDRIDLLEGDVALGQLQHPAADLHPHRKPFLTG